MPATACNSHQCICSAMSIPIHSSAGQQQYGKATHVRSITRTPCLLVLTKRAPVCGEKQDALSGVDALWVGACSVAVWISGKR